MTFGDRAERLGVLLSVAEWLPEGTAAAMEQLSWEQLLVIEDLTAEDLALANACREVELELRARAFVAVEQLVAAVGASPEPAGTVEDRVCALPDPEFRRAARLALDLHWID